MQKLKQVAVIPLLVLVFVAIAVTAMIAFSLVSRGIAEGHPSWIALGAIAGLTWLFALKLSFKR